MAKGILGTKVGMTQIFAEDGTLIPVTVVQAGPCVVIGKCLPDKQGYSAIRVGFKAIPEKKVERKLTKAEAGVFRKVGQPPMEVVSEFRLPPQEVEALKIGDAIRVDVFRKGQFVDVTGTTKGRGFAGVVKRWAMKCAARDSASSHEHHRHMGAIGQRKTPGKVWKGKHMPGHLGVEQVTTQNIQVVDVDLEQNLLLLRGAVPGHRAALVEINPSVKNKPDRPVVHIAAADSDEGDKKAKAPPKKK